MTEQERIERFETAYNRIDRRMGEIIGDDGHGNRHRTFASKVRIAANRYRRFGKFVDFLLEIGDLRNALIHNRTGDNLYMATPSEKTVTELERIEQAMFSPERVDRKFQRPVTILTPAQTLAEAFALIRDDGYSRYPVYGDDGFIGLATANGFARWVAGQFAGGQVEFDPTTVTIETILEMDHRKDLVVFISRDALVDDVVQIFADRKPLEAVIITENGRMHEKPLGLVSAMDIAGLE